MVHYSKGSIQTIDGTVVTIPSREKNTLYFDKIIPNPGLKQFLSGLRKNI